MIALMLALFAAGQAAQPTPQGPVAQAAAAPKTMQEQFNAASAAAADGRCAEAIRAFEIVEAGMRRRSPLISGAIDVRKGACLIRTGRAEEGAAAIRRGLPALIAEGPAFAGDVLDGRITLGSLAYTRQDFTGAERDYRAAAEGVQGAARIVPLLLLSRVQMFDHDGRALAAAAEARSIAAATPDYNRRQMAAVQTQYARVLLNDGKAAEAYKLLRDSLAKQGGLTNRVTAEDVATRSDLALAALQNRDRASARLYLAYTGAGRLRDGPFARAVAMDPPACGAETGLRPEDQAVVEFSLEADGHVSAVEPIYATGDRATATAFARAVAGWSWSAEDAAKVPALFRLATRVEVRCARSAAGPSPLQPLWDASIAWLATKGATASWPDDMPPAVALPLQRAARDRAEAGHDGAATILAAIAVAANPAAGEDETANALAAAERAAGTLDAPASLRAYLAIARVDQRKSAAYRLGLRQLLQRPDFAADPVAGGTLRLLIASYLDWSRPPADASVLLDQVTNDARLPPNHPLKIAALLGRANVLAAAGDLAGARATFDRTGLTSEQCALVGLQPALRRSGVDPGDYPDEARVMGFEGWVKTEFDVSADGATVAPRVVVAYPPFIFDEAATGIMQGARYSSSFRPDGALACSGQQQSVAFRLP